MFFCLISGTQSIRIVARYVFLCKHLPFDLRLMFLRSLSLAKLFFNAGTWDRLSKLAADKISSAYHRSLKTVTLHKDPKARITNIFVRAETNMPSIEIVLSCARLSVLRRLVVLDVRWTLALLHHTLNIKNGWLQMARDDWEWLRKFADADIPPFSDSDNFLLFLRSVPNTGWAALLKKARIRCLSLQRIQADRTTLVRFQKSVFEDFGHKLDEAVGEGDEPWQC